MKEFNTLYGQNKEVCTVKWHPYQETVLASGGFNGALIYWVLGHTGPHTIVGRAHNYSVNVLEWHPLGHVLASAANDGINKFWCREPPGSQLINDAANPMFSGSSTATEALDPLSTLYGPVTPELAAKVLPEVTLTHYNNASENTVPTAAGDDRTRRPFVQYGGGRGEHQQGRGFQGLTDHGGRGLYTNRQPFQHSNGDNFETSSNLSNNSYSSRGGRGAGRGRGFMGGGRFGAGSSNFQGDLPLNGMYVLLICYLYI